MKIITKQIPQKFLVINGIEVPADQVAYIVEKFECDSEYHWSYFDECPAVEDLVTVGVLGKKIGERQALIYTKNEKTDDFIKEFLELYDE